LKRERECFSLIRSKALGHSERFKTIFKYKRPGTVGNVGHGTFHVYTSKTKESLYSLSFLYVVADRHRDDLRYFLQKLERN